MKRFLLIVSAMALALVFCGTAKGNDPNGHQFDDRRFDLYLDDSRPLDSPFEFYREDFRRFDYYYQDDLPLRFNDC